MSKKVGELNQVVTITNGFPGQYKWLGGTSYYLNGDTAQGEIHFSVSGKDTEEFKSFHITPDVLSGTNVGIWFNPPNWTPSPNLKNLPDSKKSDWEKWWTTNQQNVIAVAQDFWIEVQK